MYYLSGQTSQSRKRFQKAASVISPLVGVLLVLASWTADSLDCSITSFASHGTAPLKRSVCLNPLPCAPQCRVDSE